MALVPGSERIRIRSDSNPVEGIVRWAPAKSIWIGAMTVAAVVFGPLTASVDTIALFVLTSGVTLLFGHSVGMHRRLIHSSFECPLWLEYVCVYLGTLVGMAGPIGMVRIHDFRDWAQRQPACHDYFCHRKNFFHDGWWQLHCELRLTRPPEFLLEPRLRNDRIYAFIERTWMAQQVLMGIGLFCCRGMELGHLGHLCARRNLRDRSLAGRAFRASRRWAKLDCRRRGGAGLQCSPRRIHQHGRELAQQPSCVSRVG